MTALSLGIDIGGTFTDLVVHDPALGRIFIAKESTTPDDPARGVIVGIKSLLARESIEPRTIGRIVHATTLFTNAMIERKGAKTALITTDGFRDVLEIQRERKYELYDIFIETPTPLVPRRLRREVPERMAPAGDIEVALDRVALMREVDDLVANGVTSIAVVFLHAYANPIHEHAALESIAARYPDLLLTASCDVAPEIREYERASTAVANAYVKPLARSYLDRLAGEIHGLGIESQFFLMLSNGGLTHIEEAKRSPVHLLESGPAAGALAAAYFGRKIGEDELLAFDMGGTTAKLSLVDGGEPLIAYNFEAARAKRFMEGSGLPIKISSIELIEIGAGGGSIAYVDELGLLNVGPESSGAEPGPACYGRGGGAPTVTDADLLLGYLNADFFLGGGMTIDQGAAERAIENLSAATGLTPLETAWGVHDVVNENMASAARVHITERGREPRGHAMLATGGAGPVHAYHVAAKLNLRTLVCPPAAGVGSTIGLLMAPARIDRVASMVQRLDALDWPAFEALYQKLEADARAVLADTGADLTALGVRRLADMRYVGQGSEIAVPLSEGPYGADFEPALTAAFETLYRQLFSRTPPDVAIQIINLRVSVSAPVDLAEIGFAGPAGTGRDAFKGSRQVYFAEAGGMLESTIYDRYLMPAGTVVEGPAVFEENESTLIVGPGAVCHILPDGSIVVTLPSEAPQGNRQK